MSDTPRTAKKSYVEKGEDQFLVVRAEFACELELENERLREALSVLISAGELLADECADQNRCEAWDEQRDTVNQLLSGAASA